jgi:hypothetical protein
MKWTRDEVFFWYLQFAVESGTGTFNEKWGAEAARQHGRGGFKTADHLAP